MIPGNLHPSYIPVQPCETFECSRRAEPMEACEGCGVAWVRAAAEDRREREAKDAKAKEGGKCL